MGVGPELADGAIFSHQGTSGSRTSSNGLLCTAQAHPVRGLQVLDGGALCQKLRVAQDLEVDVLVCAVPPEHLRAAIPVSGWVKAAWPADS